MRSIINISVPQKLKKEVEAEIKRGGYATTSEFFRDLLRLWKQQHLLEDLVASRKEISRGKGKVLQSLKALR